MKEDKQASIKFEISNFMPQHIQSNSSGVNATGIGKPSTEKIFRSVILHECFLLGHIHTLNLVGN